MLFKQEEWEAVPAPSLRACFRGRKARAGESKAQTVPEVVNSLVVSKGEGRDNGVSGVGLWSGRKSFSLWGEVPSNLASLSAGRKQSSSGGGENGTNSQRTLSNQQRCRRPGSTPSNSPRRERVPRKGDHPARSACSLGLERMLASSSLELSSRISFEGCMSSKGKRLI